MPYIKKISPPFWKVRELLLGKELRAKELSGVLGCAYNTAKAKIDNPEKFTLGDLLKISRNGHVPMDEIREAIKV